MATVLLVVILLTIKVALCAAETVEKGFFTDPTSCVNGFRLHGNSTGLVECLHQWTQPAGFYELEDEWRTAQPNVAERDAIENVVSMMLLWSLLPLENNTVRGSYCQSLERLMLGLDQPWNRHLQALNDTLSLAIVGDRHSCVAVLYESSIQGGFYKRGWFHLLIRLPMGRRTRLHVTAPHPIHEYPTSLEAGYFFGEFSRNIWSVLVPNHHRNVLFKRSDCIPSSNLTDPTHSTVEFTSLLSMFIWQTTAAVSSKGKLAHLQLHGHGERGACQYNTAFLSTGHSGRWLDQESWYRSRVTKNTAFRRFFAALQVGAPTFWNVSNPNSSTCKLLGATNVLGRLVNSLSVEDVCIIGANVSRLSGQFIHIEQDSLARNPPSWPVWRKVLAIFFSTSG